MIPATKSEPPAPPQETAGDPRGVARRKARMPAMNAGGPLRHLASLIAARLADRFEAESSTTAEAHGCDQD